MKFKNLLKQNNISEIKTIKVNHCLGSHGIYLKNNNNFSITYSGDCEPSELLIEKVFNFIRLLKQIF